MSGYPAYPSYKPSNVAWLGDVPEHWDVWKVTHGFNRIGSGTTPKSDNAIYYDGQIPWVTTSELRETVIYDTAQKVTEEAVASHSALKIYPKGSLAIAMYGATIGRLGMLGVDATFNQACCVFSTPVVFDTRFVYYWLWMRRPILISLSNGGGQPNLSQDDLKKIWIPIPELDEQQAIARFLDFKTAQIDALIAKKKTLLDKLAEKRTALISHAVTKGLDPSAPMKDSGVAWLGEIPAHWKAVPLRRLVRSVKTGSTPSGVNEFHFEKEGLSWFRPGDFCDQVFLKRAEKSLSEDGLAEVRLFPPLTVMHIGIGATIGKVAVTTEYASCNQQINAIICNDKLHHLFAVYFLQSIRDFIVKCGKYTTLPIINQDETKALIFTVPPRDEQIKISTFLLQKEESIDTQRQKITEVINRLLEYRSALITNAVTGKIDVRGFQIPDPSPSSCAAHV